MHKIYFLSFDFRLFSIDHINGFTQLVRVKRKHKHW